MSLAARLRRLFFSVPERAVRFDVRGLRLGDPARRERLEGIAGVFLVGYHIALDDPDPAAIAAAIAERVPLARQGFAYEGAGMALALLDAIVPGRGGRVDNLLHGPGEPHEYLIEIGVGWAIARLGLHQRRLARLSPLHQGLAADGLGFHMAFFRVQETVRRARPPRGLQPILARSFDQGVGRCLWFTECADVDAILAAIAGFDPARHGDLWSGLGLACTYAGGATDDDLDRLYRAAAAAGHAAAMAQGSAFAVMARDRAQNLAPHAEAACERLWGRPVADVVALARAAGQGLERAPVSDTPYETWRRRIQAEHREVKP
ncbi:MAG TPA: DUF1702 family protein [Nannocystaceae bacterium]|nr:DUF1702 family protein [Nannocystaceae bacterium]